MENFAEGFRCEAFQNAAGAKIEAATQVGEFLVNLVNLVNLVKLAEEPHFIEKLCSATKLIFGSMGM